MELLEPLKSQEFTDEQKQYLLGFFSAATQRTKTLAGQTARLVTSVPAFASGNQADKEEKTYFGTPVSDLCREEIWKYDENPLDIWTNSLRTPTRSELARSALEQHIAAHRC